MRFDLQHPRILGLTATYGYDGSLVEFFLTIRSSQVEYDGLRPGYTGIPGLLALLVAHGFFDGDDLLLAREELAHRVAGEIEDPEVRRAAMVIERLLAAANEG